MRHLPNYVGMCIFVPWSRQQIYDAVEAVTGWTETALLLPRIVERGLAMARIFNLREGFSRSEDTLPHRFFESPSEGPLSEIAVDPGKLETAQRAYFELLGWDEAGVPTQEKLDDLGIGWASRYIK